MKLVSLFLILAISSITGSPTKDERSFQTNTRYPTGSHGYPSSAKNYTNAAIAYPFGKKEYSDGWHNTSGGCNYTIGWVRYPNGKQEFRSNMQNHSSGMHYPSDGYNITGVGIPYPSGGQRFPNYEPGYVGPENGYAQKNTIAALVYPFGGSKYKNGTHNNTSGGQEYSSDGYNSTGVKIPYPSGGQRFPIYEPGYVGPENGYAQKTTIAALVYPFGGSKYKNGTHNNTSGGQEYPSDGYNYTIGWVRYPRGKQEFQSSIHNYTSSGMYNSTGFWIP